MLVTVQGGTRAGWRRIREKPAEWVCSGCGKLNKYARCLTGGCNRKREEQQCTSR